MNVVFWNVDSQKDFMLKGGLLYVEGAEEIIPNLKRLTDFARKEKITIVSTGDYHTSESKELSDTPDFINTFPKHCMADEEGSDFIDETDPKKDFEGNYYISSYLDDNVDLDKVARSKNIIIYKDAFNVVDGNQFTKQIVKAISPDVIVVYGVATNVCVDQAVLELLNLNKKIIVIKDAIKGLPNLPVDNIIETWKTRGAFMIDTDTFINMANFFE